MFSLTAVFVVGRVCVFRFCFLPHLKACGTLVPGRPGMEPIPLQWKCRTAREVPVCVIEVKFRVSKQKLLLYCVCVTDKSAAIFYLFDKIGTSEVFTCSTRF